MRNKRAYGSGGFTSRNGIRRVTISAARVGYVTDPHYYNSNNPPAQFGGIMEKNIMQFLTNTVMDFVNICAQIIQTPFIQKILIAILGVIAGIFINRWYLKQDKARDEAKYHESTADRQWIELPSGIWYTTPVLEIPVSNHTLVFGLEITPEEQQAATQPTRIKLIMFVDYPASMRGLSIEAREKTIAFGYEKVDCLPGINDRRWEITRELTPQFPEGYVGERLELIMNVYTDCAPRGTTG